MKTSLLLLIVAAATAAALPQFQQQQQNAPPPPPPAVGVGGSPGSEEFNPETSYLPRTGSSSSTGIKGDEYLKLSPPPAPANALPSSHSNQQQHYHSNIYSTIDDDKAAAVAAAVPSTGNGNEYGETLPRAFSNLDSYANYPHYQTQRQQ